MRTIFLGVALLALMAATAASARACAPHNGKRANAPQLGAAIIIVLQHVQLSPLESQKIRERQEEIARLASKGREGEARKIEEETMNLLGYAKTWTRCGPAIFTWVKRVEYRPQAVHDAPRLARFADIRP